MSLLLIHLLISVSYGCDQTTYDKIYKQIIESTLDRPLTQQSIVLKNDTVEILRKLCNGQVSSYETGTFKKE